jgi:hypothetical protein
VKRFWKIWIFSAADFFKFWPPQKPGSGSGMDSPESLDPNPSSVNRDLQHLK